MSGAQKPVYVSTLQQRIAELAREEPGMAFTSLAHLIDIAWLREAYRRTRSLAVPILMHSAFNGVTFLILMYGPPEFRQM